MQGIDRYGDIVALRFFLFYFILISGCNPSVIHVFVVKDEIASEEKMEVVSQMSNVSRFLLIVVDDIFHESTAQDELFSVNCEVDVIHHSLLSGFLLIVYVTQNHLAVIFGIYYTSQI